MYSKTNFDWVRMSRLFYHNSIAFSETRCSKKWLFETRWEKKWKQITEYSMKYAIYDNNNNKNIK